MGWLVLSQFRSHTSILNKTYREKEFSPVKHFNNYHFLVEEEGGLLLFIFEFTSLSPCPTSPLAFISFSCSEIFFYFTLRAFICLSSSSAAKSALTCFQIGDFLPLYFIYFSCYKRKCC